MTVSALTKRRQALTVALIFVGFICIDQAVKVWVKTHMALHESIRVTDWFYITFIENNGMAFGMEFFDKIFLTGFRILATIGVGYYISRLIRRGVSWGFLICLAFIMTGAAGNIIDCLFYGLIWDYAPFMFGKVVDMFYFPLIHNSMGDVIFFSPVFNFADSCVTVGAFYLILFQWKFFAADDKKTDDKAA